VHFDQCLADQRGTEEGPKRNKEMSTCNASKVKQRIWYLHITFTCTMPHMILTNRTDINLFSVNWRPDKFVWENILIHPIHKLERKSRVFSTFKLLFILINKTALLLVNFKIIIYCWKHQQHRLLSDDSMV